MKTARLLLATLFVMVAIGFTQVAKATPMDLYRVQHIMLAGFFVGPTAAAVATNKVTTMLGASATIDFTTATTTCTESSAITVTGAVVGDVCAVGTPAAGGSANATYTCYVSATNAVKVRHCAAGTADDPASGTFYVRTISAQ